MAVVVFCLLVPSAAVGYLADQRAAESPPRERVELVIGVSTDLPGWGLTQGARRSGFDLDLANYLADELHYTPTFVRVRDEDRREMLRSGQVQLVISHFSVTEERTRDISFAGPYLQTRQGLMGLTDGPQIRTIEDLSGKRVCVVNGSTAADQFSEHDITVIGNPDLQSCALGTRSGEFDATAADQILLFGITKAYRGSLAVVPDLTFGDLEHYGVGLEYGNTKLCNELRDGIRRFITSDAWDDAFQANLPDVPSAAYKPDPGLLDRCE
jgi:glutamate transport system substrate-binding protein